jgi:hypothetical protein
MATEVLCTVVPGGLMALNAVQAENLEGLCGKQVKAVISQPRNPAFHNKFFALLGVARDMADTEYNANQFRAYVTVGAGYCEFITDDEGGVVALPKSISFGSMDETEFERLYQDVLTFICKTWVLDENQLNAIVDFM